MSSIIQLFQPTHILYLTSEKDLHALDVPVFSHSNSKKCKIFKVEVGRKAPSKVAANELRTLRTISYFLRDSDYIRNEFTMKKISSSSSSPYSLPIYVRNGSIVDSRGIIATALLKAPSLKTSLSSVSLRSLTGSISPRLVLALFNFSLVGVHISDTSKYEDSKKNTMIRLKYPSSSGEVNVLCDYDDQGVASLLPIPCEGVALVHSVDPIGQNIKLITSHYTHDSLMTSSSLSTKRSAQYRTTLIRGSCSMTVPVVMSYHPLCGFPFMPYQTGELAGEGVGSMKVGRNNVKRKGQQQQ